MFKGKKNRMRHINLGKENCNNTKYYFMHICVAWEKFFSSIEEGDNGTTFAN